MHIYRERQSIPNVVSVIISSYFPLFHRTKLERLVPKSLPCWSVEMHPTGKTTKKVSE